jgi:hypothetical protein
MEDTKESNYTPEMVTFMKETYLGDPTRATIELLAEKYGKSVRSIVGKLSKEGIYKKPSYLTKRGEVPISKDEIVEHIARVLNEPSEMLEGLEKAPKPVLRKILEALNPKAVELFQPKGK